MSKLLEMMEEVQRLQEKVEARHHSQEALQAEAASPPRTSGRLSSLFPFALLQRHSSKPVLPTSGWKALGDEDDLAKREDEFVDLGDVWLACSMAVREDPRRLGQEVGHVGSPCRCVTLKPTARGSLGLLEKSWFSFLPPSSERLCSWNPYLEYYWKELVRDP